jgi:HPt (histidine-containing phosphotransfer) domain-containing protein
MTLAALRRAETDGDWTRAAHTLKGSARAVGAWRMASLAERAESLGGTADRAACDELLERLEEETAAARAYIATLESLR